MGVGPRRWGSLAHDTPRRPRMSKVVAEAVLAGRSFYLTWRLADGWRCLTAQHPEVVLHPPMRGATNRLARRIAECYEAANRLAPSSTITATSRASHLPTSTPAPTVTPTACTHRCHRLAERAREHARRGDSGVTSHLTLVEKASTLLLLFTKEADDSPQDQCATAQDPCGH